MGNFVKVNLKNFGIVDVDKSISNLIKKLNEANIVTYNCCSGLLEEHPRQKNILDTSDGYIMLEYTEEVWQFLCNSMDYLVKYEIFAILQVSIPYDRFGNIWGNHIRLSIKGNTDKIRKLQWKAIEDLFFAHI